MGEVEIEWMINLSSDLVYINTLKEQLVTEQAPAAQDDPPKVSLLFVGGKTDEAIANKLGLSVQEVTDAHATLKQLEGTEVEIELTHVLRDELCATTRVLLPEGLPVFGTPFLTLTRSQDQKPNYANELFRRCDTNELLDEPLEPRVRLRGKVFVKMDRVQRRPREKQHPHEGNGEHVHVKKHNQLGCAVVTLPSELSCQKVLAKNLKEINSSPVDIKQHEEKQPDGVKVPVPNMIFCGWNKKDYQLTAADLVAFFDMETKKVL